MSNQEKIIFIVGNSRSGTTMMRRILGNHPDCYMMEEFHFFEQLWSPADQKDHISREKAILIAAKLLFIQRDGYLNEMNTEKYKEEAIKIVDLLGHDVFAHEIFKSFLFYETNKNKRAIPCEKTPQDVFYLQEILALFPAAKIINMVRDPRGVMLSQKRKWQRKNMGADNMTKKEQRRLKINYHPIIISKLWNASVRAVLKFKSHSQVYHIKFENLVSNSEFEINSLCRFLEIKFFPAMLMIPQVGSSNEVDKPDEFGIKAERAGNWEKGGLNKGEIYFCEKICGSYMQQYGYATKNVKPEFLYLIYYYFSLPAKILLALLFNIHRTKSLLEAVKRRLI